MTPDELRQHIELKVVELIKLRMKAGQMNEERAQQISQLVLETLKPGMTFEELYRAIPTLDDTAPELASVVLPMLESYEKNVNQKALEQVRELIHQGQYDAAAKLGKQAVNQRVKLMWQGAGKAE